MRGSTFRAVLTIAVLLGAESCSLRSPKPLVVLGDSIVAWNSERIESDLSDCCRTEVSGVGGARIDEMLSHAADLALTDPHVAIVDLGTNDALQSTDPDVTRVALTQLVDTFGSARCTYLVNVTTSLEPSIDTPSTAERVSDAATSVNEALAEVASERFRVEVIDWDGAVRAAEARGVALTIDSVHPNDAGIAELTDLFRTAVRRCPG